MNLADRIRDAMSAHGHEAPTEFRAGRRVGEPAPSRRARWLPAAAAASLVLALVIGVVAVQSGGGGGSTAPASTALTCPAEYVSSSPGNGPGVPGLWVPAHAHGVDGDSRLVPRQTPGHVVVCAYLASDPPAPGSPPRAVDRAVALSGGKELDGDLSRVTNALSWLPRKLAGQGVFCRDYLAATDRDAYLVGLSYPHGTIWVSAPGDHCGGASNGTFATMANLRAPVAAAYATRRWPASNPPSRNGDPCRVGSLGRLGRLGQEAAMVPGDPVAATVCEVRYASQQSAATSRVVQDLGPLATALNSLPTRPNTSGCTGSGSQTVFYEALFRYADGPPVFLRVQPHCKPSLDNGSLSADHAGATVSILRGLLSQH